MARSFSFDNTNMGRFLESVFPDAMECSNCEYVWSPAEEEKRRRFREIDWSKVTKAEPFDASSLKYPFECKCKS